MRQLLDFILAGIVGAQGYEIEENLEGDRSNFIIKAPNESIGIIIGKGGRIVKAIRNLMKVRATLEKKGVTLSVEPKE
ncbi:MAG: KH domain-containing protein [Patescibacteria group bacterium]